MQEKHTFQNKCNSTSEQVDRGAITAQLGFVANHFFHMYNLAIQLALLLPSHVLTHHTNNLACLNLLYLPNSAIQLPVPACTWT
jgi:hypothetical protein